MQATGKEQCGVERVTLVFALSFPHLRCQRKDGGWKRKRAPRTQHSETHTTQRESSEIEHEGWGREESKTHRQQDRTPRTCTCLRWSKRAVKRWISPSCMEAAAAAARAGTRRWSEGAAWHVTLRDGAEACGSAALCCRGPADRRRVLFRPASGSGCGEQWGRVGSHGCQCDALLCAPSVASPAWRVWDEEDKRANCMSMDLAVAAPMLQPHARSRSSSCSDHERRAWDSERRAKQFRLHQIPV